jgi:hypothetical protein
MLLLVILGQIERLEVSKAQGLAPNSYTSHYSNLATFCQQHKYKPNDIWNFDKTGIHVGSQARTKVLAKRGS